VAQYPDITPSGDIFLNRKTQQSIDQVIASNFFTENSYRRVICDFADYLIKRNEDSITRNVSYSLRNSSIIGDPMPLAGLINTSTVISESTTSISFDNSPDVANYLSDSDPFMVGDAVVLAQKQQMTVNGNQTNVSSVSVQSLAGGLAELAVYRAGGLTPLATIQSSDATSITLDDAVSVTDGEVLEVLIVSTPSRVTVGGSDSIDVSNGLQSAEVFDQQFGNIYVLNITRQPDAAYQWLYWFANTGYRSGFFSFSLNAITSSAIASLQSSDTVSFNRIFNPSIS